MDNANRGAGSVRRAARSGFAVALLASALAGQETGRASVDSSGAEADKDSYRPAISADGQSIAFMSYASNLVAGDTNKLADVFVHDRVTGVTVRVSVDSNGAEGNDESLDPTISADGRYVAFTSNASNLVASDGNGTYDVFVHDRVTGVTERASVSSSGVEGNGRSETAILSADGLHVAFMSMADNLVSRDDNGYNDVFVRNLATGKTRIVSVDSSGAASHGYCVPGGISSDGLFVAFTSNASDLVAGDSNGKYDAFLRDRANGTTVRVSVDSSGAEGNEDSWASSLSEDGRLVAFYSGASNLVAGDGNGASDVFVHDRTTGITARVSVDSSGAESNGDSRGARLTADGAVVAFLSSATNLVAGDTNASFDAFVHDRISGATERISVDSSGTEANGHSSNPALSDDGEFVAFESGASNLVPGDNNSTWDVFVRARCLIAASWTNYGTGFPGTLGVPTFTSRADPVLGEAVALDLSNSAGVTTDALVFLGFQRTSVHSVWGGDLLVVPSVVLPIRLPAAGFVLSGDLPADHGLCGVALDLQAIERDSGAARGVSFTEGLELTLGH